MGTLGLEDLRPSWRPEKANIPSAPLLSNEAPKVCSLRLIWFCLIASVPLEAVEPCEHTSSKFGSPPSGISKILVGGPPTDVLEETPLLVRPSSPSSW